MQSAGGPKFLGLVVQIETATYLVPTMRHGLINVPHLPGRGNTGTHQGALEYMNTLKPYQKKTGPTHLASKECGALTWTPKRRVT